MKYFIKILSKINDAFIKNAITQYEKCKICGDADPYIDKTNPFCYKHDIDKIAEYLFKQQDAIVDFFDNLSEKQLKEYEKDYPKLIEIYHSLKEQPTVSTSDNIYRFNDGKFACEFSFANLFSDGKKLVYTLIIYIDDDQFKIKKRATYFAISGYFDSTNGTPIVQAVNDDNGAHYMDDIVNKALSYLFPNNIDIDRMSAELKTFMWKIVESCGINIKNGYDISDVEKLSPDKDQYFGFFITDFKRIT